MAKIERSDFSVDIHELRNFTEEQKKVVRHICQVIGELVPSPEFEERILGFRYITYEKTLFSKKKVVHNNFYMNQGHSNAKVYQKLLSGSDMFHVEQDHDLDLAWTLYYENSSVIGYTYPSTSRIWVNERFFAGWLRNKEGRANIIGNILHEYMHKVGYTHSFNYTSLRQYTVPYAIGDIATDVAIDHFYADL